MSRLVGIRTVQKAIKKWREQDEKTEQQQALIDKWEEYKAGEVSSEEIRTLYQKHQKQKNPARLADDVVREAKPSVTMERDILVQFIGRALASIHIMLHMAVSERNEMGSPTLSLADVLSDLQKKNLEYSDFVLSGWIDTADAMVRKDAKISVKHAVWLDFTALSIERIVQLFRRDKESMKDLNSAIAAGNYDAAIEIMRTMKENGDE